MSILGLSYSNNTVQAFPTTHNLAANRTKFKGNSKDTKDNLEDSSSEYTNPVSKTGEYFNALHKSFMKSLGAGSRIFIQCAVSHDDSDSRSSSLGTSAMIGGIAAAVYFLFSLPGNIYQANIDYFTKKKDMDVFVREKSIEKKCYEQIDNKIEKGDKDQIKNYQKMKIAGSNTPDSLKNNDSSGKEFLDGFVFN